MTASGPPRASRPPERAVTISEVASAAGVGRQTVSNVLNGSGRVGAAARAKVLQIVSELGYHPHQGARSLRSRRAMQIAYLMPQVELVPGNLIMMQFLQSLVRAGADRGYGVVVIADKGDPRDDMRRMVASRSVDAFVLSELLTADPRVELLSELGVPFACFGRIRPSLPQHWVDIDNVAAEVAAVDHVLTRGFTRPGYVGYASAQYWDAERAAGFRAGLARHGIPGDGAGLLEVTSDARGRARIRSFISAARPDAVITGSDMLAAIVYSVAAELDLRIGRDLAVIGFDGSVGGLLYPRLTSVVIPVDEIARRVVDRAVQQIDHGPDSEPGEIVLARLRPGGSTSPSRGTISEGPRRTLAQ